MGTLQVTNLQNFKTNLRLKFDTLQRSTILTQLQPFVHRFICILYCPSDSEIYLTSSLMSRNVCLTYCHLKIPFSDVLSGRDDPDAPGPEAGSLVHQELQSQILQQQHIHSIEN